MKYLAIDYGLARTGLAVSDPDGSMAFPLATLRLDDFASRKELLAALASRIQSEQAQAVVVGLPCLSDGSDSLTTRQVRNFTERLKRRISQPVFFMAEELSSEEAWSSLREAGMRRGSRRAVLDQQAAVLILESFLRLPEHRRMAA